MLQEDHQNARFSGECAEEWSSAGSISRLSIFKERMFPVLRRRNVAALAIAEEDQYDWYDQRWDELIDCGR